MVDSTPIKPTSDDTPDRTIYECTGCGTVTRDRAAQMALYKRAGALSCCPERNMVPVKPVEPAPAQDEQETFKRALLTQCVFKLNSDTMSAARWAWFHRPAQTEQQPVVYAVHAKGASVDQHCPLVSPEMATDYLPGCATALYAAPVVAQTAPKQEQSGLVAAAMSAKSAIESLILHLDAYADRPSPVLDRRPVEHGDEAIRMIDAALSAWENCHDR